MKETWIQFLGWEYPLEESMTTPVILPGESLWTEELGGLNPWSGKESDTTEKPSFSIRNVFLKREEGKVQWQSTSKKKTKTKAS